MEHACGKGMWDDEKILGKVRCGGTRSVERDEMFEAMNGLGSWEIDRYCSARKMGY